MLLCSRCVGHAQTDDVPTWDGSSTSSEDDAIEITARGASLGKSHGRNQPKGSDQGSSSTADDDAKKVTCLNPFSCGTRGTGCDRDVDWESVSESEGEEMGGHPVLTDLIIRAPGSRLSRIPEEEEEEAECQAGRSTVALTCVRDFVVESTELSRQLSHIASHKLPRGKGLATRKLIMDAVLADHLCSTLSVEDVQQIMASMEFYCFRSGETIIEQEEPGCHFFAVHTGNLDVMVDGKRVNSLVPGRAFGSLALLYNCPRNASVVASSATACVWGCDGRAFRDIVRANAQRHHREHRGFMDSVTLFDGLSQQQKDRLGEAFLAETHLPGAQVVTEGQTARVMYVVRKGRLQVIVAGQMVRELVSGDCFGERALLYNEPRSATVRAVTACELLCVTYSQLKAAIGQDLSPRLLKRNLLLMGLRSSPVFARFSPSQQLALAEKMRFESFAPSAHVELAEFGVIVDGEAIAPVSLKALGPRVLKRGQWFGDASLVEGSAGQLEVAERGVLLQRLIGKLLTERKGSQGFCTQDLVRLTAGARGCSIAMLTAENLAVVLRDLGIEGIEGAGAALDYARRVQAVTEVYIFQYLSQKQTDMLVSTLLMQRYAKGAFVIKQGEHARTFHVVAGGELEVLVDGKRVRTLGKGAFFGERALIFDGPRAASVQVLSDSADIWSIERSTFEQIVKGRLKEQLMQRVVMHNPHVTLKDLRHIRILGKGSFGVVRLVQHTRTGVRYALKRVNKESGSIPPELLRECEMLADLDHPLMVYLVNTMETSTSVYMLTELLSGGDLYSALRKLGWSLPLDQARFYAGCMAVALEALHNRGIVYRDLKPQNIMLDSQGYPKLIDFGTAKRLRGVRTFTAIGTPYYIAPEILQGRGYGTEVDLWSFGVLVYEMVCGRYPFANGIEDVAQVYREVLKGPLEFPSSVTNHAAVELIEGLLQRRPEERLGSGLQGWEEIRDADFFSPEDLLEDESLFDQLMSRELEPPLVVATTEEARSAAGKGADLDDAHEFAD